MTKKSIERVLFAIFFCSPWMFSPMAIQIAEAAPPLVLRIDNPSPEQDALFGRAVEGLSDINGDGISDLAVGVRGSDRVYLLSGADQSVIHTIDDPDGVAGFWFGFTVRGVGDVNGDEVEDVAVGAPAVYGSFPVPCPPGDTDPECEAQIGRAFVFSGATGEMILRIANLRFHLGASVAPLGDINDDGIPDFAVGAPFLLHNSSGEVYAITGADGSILWNTLEPAGQAFASLGGYMSEIEDLNGDGHRDLLVGAHFSGNSSDFLPGKAYILSGYDGSIWRTVESPAPVDNGFFGGQPCAIGDQDGDGIEDFAVGEAGVGRLHLFRGATGSLMRSIEDPEGSSTDFFGFSIAEVDDKDGDGCNDFWVAASKGGRVYLMNGMGDVLLQIDDPNPSGLGDEGAFGWSISGTGDLADDGALDLIIGKSVETVGDVSRAGAAFLVLGVSPNHPPVANAGSDQIVPVGPDCMASVTLNGGASYDPDEDPLTYIWTWEGGAASGPGPSVRLGKGAYEITLVVNDGSEDSPPDSVQIVVVDETPPEISVRMNPEVLWPPNHKMVRVDPIINTSDNCSNGITVSLISITSNEVSDGDDIFMDDDGNIFLKAERLGTGDDRIYTLTYTATDSSANSSTTETIVTVPHDKRKKNKPKRGTLVLKQLIF